MQFDTKKSLPNKPYSRDRSVRKIKQLSHYFGKTPAINSVFSNKSIIRNFP